MSSSGRTLVIVPAHNESDNLGRVLDEIHSTGLLLDVLVVDDCSTDGTAGIARQRGTLVLQLANNLGYGGAVQSGFRYAVHYGYDYCVLMDADGQHAAASIPALLTVVRSGQADVALGSRFLGRMEDQTTFVKRGGMTFFSQVVSRITGHRVTDPTSGFQALNRD